MPTQNVPLTRWRLMGAIGLASTLFLARATFTSWRYTLDWVSPRAWKEALETDEGKTRRLLTPQARKTRHAHQALAFVDDVEGCRFGLPSGPAIDLEKLGANRCPAPRNVYDMTRHLSPGFLTIVLLSAGIGCDPSEGATQEECQDAYASSRADEVPHEITAEVAALPETAKELGITTWKLLGTQTSPNHAIVGYDNQAQEIARVESSDGCFAYGGPSLGFTDEARSNTVWCPFTDPSAEEPLVIAELLNTHFIPASVAARQGQTGEAGFEGDDVNFRFGCGTIDNYGIKNWTGITTGMCGWCISIVMSAWATAWNPFSGVATGVAVSAACGTCATMTGVSVSELVCLIVAGEL